jgi:hypothetical protein
VLLLGFAAWRLTDPSAAARLELDPGSGRVTGEAVQPIPPDTAVPRRAAIGPQDRTRPEPPWRAHSAALGRDTPRVALPRQFEIPRLGISMPIMASTVNGDGQMALPNQPGRIGWYAYGPRPGDRVGSAVLGGHVDSRQYGIGPLAELRRVRRGDKVIVRTAAGQKVFEVDSVRLIDKRALTPDEIFDRSGPARLRILTCGGPYLPGEGGYQRNVVVSATQR